MSARVRRAWWVAVVVVLSPVTVLPPAAADCPSPSIEVQPTTVAPGGSVTVRGDAFMQECNDTSVACVPARRSPPITGVDLQLQTEDEVLASVIVDADDAYGFEVQLTVPERTPPGAYDVVAVIGEWPPTQRILVVPPDGDG